MKFKIVLFALLFSGPAFALKFEPPASFPAPTPVAGEVLNGLWLGEGEGFANNQTDNLKKGSVFLNLTKVGSQLQVKAAITLDDAKIIRLWLDGTYQIAKREDRNFVLLNNVVVGEIVEDENTTELHLSYFDIATDGAIPVFPALKVTVSSGTEGDAKAAEIYYSVVSAGGVLGEFKSRLPLLITPKSKINGGWDKGWGFGPSPFPGTEWGSGWGLPPSAGNAWSGGFGSPIPGFGWGRPGSFGGQSPWTPLPGSSWGLPDGIGVWVPFPGNGWPGSSDGQWIPLPGDGWPGSSEGQWVPLPGNGWGLPDADSNAGWGGFPPPPPNSGWGLPGWGWNIPGGQDGFGLPPGSWTPWPYGVTPSASTPGSCSDLLTGE